VTKLLDARFVMFVGFRQDGHDCTGVYQYRTDHELPNPSKCFGLVLRSRLAPRAAPINPAFLACSYAVSTSSSMATGIVRLWIRQFLAEFITEGHFGHHVRRMRRAPIKVSLIMMTSCFVKD
jgi:hypothetical protein